MINRRLFIRRAAGTALASAVFPSIVPVSVLGAEGKPSPSNRVLVGCIGTGEQGRGVMQGFLNDPLARVTAVCDVKRSQRELAQGAVHKAYQNQDCVTYDDFRTLLARKDIDAVLIATPDHWHVPAALAAVNAGKDVYLEKPMGLSLAEDQLLRQAVQKHKRIFQFGTQQRSDANFRKACELVLNGCIGSLKQINVWSPGSVPGGSTREVPPPEDLNYDFWLGPARFTPHTEHKCSNDYRVKTWWFNYDYALGFIGGWGVHPLDIAYWGAKPHLTGQAQLEGQGEIPKEGACNTTTRWNVLFKFASGVLMDYRGLLIPNNYDYGQVVDPEFQARYGRTTTHGTAFEGTDGWVQVDRQALHTHPASLLKEKPDDFKLRLPISTNHVHNFLECVQSRQPAVSPIEDAVQADLLCHLSDLTTRLNRKLTFDFDTERFVKDDEANQRLRLREMRKPWNLA
jgi:predicted dehydrogenase